MKVYFFCQFLFSEDGRRSGHTSLLRQCVPEFLSRGYDVEIVALSGVHDDDSPCKVHILQNISHRPNWNRIFKVFYWIMIIARLTVFVISNFGKLKQSSLVTLTAGASFLLPFFFRRVYIWENVAYLQKRPLIDICRLWLMLFLRAIIVVPTSNECSSLKRIFPKYDVRFIRNWFSPNIQKKNRHIPPKSLKFLSAGILQKRKGFDLLIEAVFTIKQSLDQDVRFHIYGDGEERSALKNLIQQYEVDNFIKLKGPRNGLENIYRDYDIFILPSRLEGFPLVMIDSLACGLPVIAFDCPTGPREIIRSGYNGVLVDNGDIESLSASILSFTQDKKIVALSEGACLSAEPFSMDLIIDEWEIMIKENQMCIGV